MATDTHGGATGRDGVRRIPFERLGRDGARRIPFGGIGLALALAVSVTGVAWTAGLDETGVEVAPPSTDPLHHPSAAPAPPRATAPSPSPSPDHARPSHP
ncbi:hypothetical protein [Streptomyces sp. cg2]|uniref:hypothetical protein n=1 Tax=Streptomyces sp. cg2 TaxID=3238799 RepID=UPI0034E2559A